MSDTGNQATGDTSQSVEEFLGEKKRPWWRRWYTILAVVVLLVLVLSLAFCSGEQGPPAYITEEVTQESLDLSVTATGNLRPTNQVEVGSEVSGRIDRVLVDVNDRVTRGQVIAQINTEIIDQQIAQARAGMNAQRAALTQARATLDVDRAQLARLREVAELSGGKVPSQTELEQAEAAVARDRAAVAAAQANIEAAEATLQSNVTQRGRAVIRAPVTGVVLARQVEPGQTVAASFNTPTLFVIAEDLAAMELQVAIDEADVGQVEEGQTAYFTVDAYPGRRFPARVERVDLASTNTVQSATSGLASGAAGASVVNYEARLIVQNPEGLLRPGMTATATITTESTGNVLLVPNAALRFRPDAQEEQGGGMLQVDVGLDQQEQQATIGVGSRQQVHVLEEDGTLRTIEVVTGESDGRRTVVRSSDLRAGMEVVTGKRAPGA
ncbi:efflux RND transporter periplasmic adaptor subunit [Qipengyuania sp. JC766]|uniref:efflux RND transporter periplasmic adaptor subunit n=1 Tax=Qipengyuania sp. JC766 TaxID=3232139 RepID=UPI003458F9AA